MKSPLKLRGDFVVRIGPGLDGLRAEVLESPIGERAEVPFRIPFDAAYLDGLERWIGESTRSGEAEGSPRPTDQRNVQPLPEPRVDLAREAGTRLFEALFVGEVRKRWDDSVLLVEHSGDHPRRRIVLQLRFDASRAGDGGLLSRLPWELLYSLKHGGFLALRDRFSVVRRPEVSRPAERPPVPARPVVLVAAASPEGPGAPGILDLPREIALLRAALSGIVDLKLLERTTLESLREELRADAVHVLHFMGHGDLDPERGEGVLLLEGEGGWPTPVTASRLMEAVGDSLSSLRLVVLNACQTAVALPGIPTSGIATGIVERGVGAVVAMRHPISDGAALAFSEGLYRSLASEDDVDEAVRAGRREIEKRDRASAEWAIPALFLRSSGGPLFVRKPERRLTRWRTIGLLGALALVALVALWLALGTAPEPGGRADRGPEGRPSVDEPASPALPFEIRRLPLGEPVRLPEIDAVVTADRVVVLGEEMVRLTVAPDHGGSAIRAVFPGETATFRWSRAGAPEILEIQVLSLDRAERAVEVRALRRPAAEDE